MAVIRTLTPPPSPAGLRSGFAGAVDAACDGTGVSGPPRVELTLGSGNVVRDGVGAAVAEAVAEAVDGEAVDGEASTEEEPTETDGLAIAVVAAEEPVAEALDVDPGAAVLPDPHAVTDPSATARALQASAPPRTCFTWSRSSGRVVVLEQVERAR